MNRLKLFLVTMMLFATTAYAQETDSLLKSMNVDKKDNRVEATFKSTHVVLSQSTETQKIHDLDLRIRHHFGDIGGEFGGAHTLFGLDGATDLFIGLDYGINDKLTVSIGRSKHNEMFNGFLKYRLLQQKTDESMPVNVTLFGQMGWIARKPNNNLEFTNYANRFSYLIQPIISRKVYNRLSLQIAPTVLFRKNTIEARDPESLFSIGFAGRMKLTNRLSFIADYTLVNGLNRPTDLVQTFYNPFGVGLEIETGGHIFSLNFMNSENILENNFIPSTQKSWTNGGVRFGFTISRNFTLFKSKDKDIQSKIY